MSWRIEHADALTLLRELPDRWAQTCVTAIPRDLSPAQAFAIFWQLRRVLRDDATVWLLREPAEPLLAGLLAQGWLRQRPPVWARPLSAGQDPSLRVCLLTMSERYLLRALPAGAGASASWRRASTTVQARRAQWCAVRPGQCSGLVRSCLLAGSSPLACGVCGAPCERPHPARAGGIGRPGCAHHSPHGRCLVLDPFYRSCTPTAQIAACHGRSFLGITHQPGGLR